MAHIKPSDHTILQNLENERLKTLFETSNFQFQCLDAAGNILEVNPSWLQSLGYSKKEVIGKYFGSFLTTESCRRFEDGLAKLSAKAEKRSMELTLLCRDGSKIYSVHSCTANFNHGGSLVSLYCIFENVTRLRLVEQALLDSEHKYLRLVELSNVGIFEIDPHTGAFIYANELIREHFGLNDENISSFKIENFLTDEGKVDYSRHLKNFLSSKSLPNLTEYQILNPGGEDKWVQISNRVVADKSGKYKIIGVAQDITERKHLEIELQNNLDLFEKVISSLPSIVFQFTYENREVDIQYISSNVEEIIGYTREDIQKKPLHYLNLIHRKDLGTLFSEITPKLFIQEVIEFSFRLKNAKGSYTLLRTRLSKKVLSDKKVLFTGISTDITEQAVLKEELKNTEEKFKSLVDSANPGITSMSKSGIITSVNPRICELSGYKEEEIVGLHFMRAPQFYPRDIPRYVALYKNALKGIIPSDPERFEWKHRSGEKRWGEAYLSAIRKGGKVVEYQAIMIDITDRVEMEAQEEKRKEELNFLFHATSDLLSLENEEQLYKFLAEQIYKLVPGVIVVVNSCSEDHTRLRVEAVQMGSSSVFKKALGLFGNSIIGQEFKIDSSTFNYALPGRLGNYNSSFYDLTMGQLPPKLCEQIEKLIGLDKIYEISLSTTNSIIGGAAILLKKGVEMKSAAVIETLFREASATLVRLRTNKRLNENEQLYRSLAESTGDWIGRFNKSNEFVFVNGAVLSTFDKESAEVIGHTCKDLGYSDEYAKLIHGNIQRTFRTAKESRCEIELEIKGDTEFYEWNFIPEFMTEFAKVDTVLVLARNITERKIEEGRQLDHVAKKNKMYSILTHDLRSPFNGILGFTDLLKSEYHSLSDEKRLEYISIVEEAARNSLKLFESILKWTSDNDGPEMSKPVFFNLRSLVLKAVELNKVSLTKFELNVNIDIASNILIMADYNMIYTVFRNLLANAIKFSERGGRISISALEKGNEIICKVQDEGRGMSQEQIANALINKKHDSSPDQSGQRGHGLGLGFAKEMIENHKGKLWIESELGHGTRVYFSLYT